MSAQDNCRAAGPGGHTFDLTENGQTWIGGMTLRPLSQQCGNSFNADDGAAWRPGQGGSMTVTGDAAASDCRQAPADAPAEGSKAWMGAYIRRTAITDCACALAAGVLAAELRFAVEGHVPRAYLLLPCVLPALWWASVLLAGGYDSRLIGLGSDEFRRVLKAAVGLAAGIAIVAYATSLHLARGYL